MELYSLLIEIPPNVYIKRKNTVETLEIVNIIALENLRNGVDNLIDFFLFGSAAGYYALLVNGRIQGLLFFGVDRERGGLRLEVQNIQHTIRVKLTPGLNSVIRR